MKWIPKSRTGLIGSIIFFIVIVAVLTSLLRRTPETPSSGVDEELVESIFNQAVESLRDEIVGVGNDRYAAGVNEALEALEPDSISAARGRELQALDKLIATGDQVNAEAYGPCRGAAWVSAAEDNFEENGVPMTIWLYDQLDSRQRELNEWLGTGERLTMTAEQKDEVINKTTTELVAIAEAIRYLRQPWIQSIYEQRLADYEVAKAAYDAELENLKEGERPQTSLPPEPVLESADLKCNPAVYTLEENAADLVGQAMFTREIEARQLRIGVNGGGAAINGDENIGAGGEE